MKKVVWLYQEFLAEWLGADATNALLAEHERRFELAKEMVAVEKDRLRRMRGLVALRRRKEETKRKNAAKRLRTLKERRREESGRLALTLHAETEFSWKEIGRRIGLSIGDPPRSPVSAAVAQSLARRWSKKILAGPRTDPDSAAAMYFAREHGPSDPPV